MAQIYAGSANYVPKNTTKTVHSKAGKLRLVIVTADAQPGTITFYDNTGGSGTILLVLDVVSTTPIPQVIDFNLLTPLVFTTGLTIVTSANCRCFVITEA
jgi:hypothetical protein